MTDGLDFFLDCALGIALAYGGVFVLLATIHGFGALYELLFERETHDLSGN